MHSDRLAFLIEERIDDDVTTTTTAWGGGVMGQRNVAVVTMMI